MPPSPPPCKYSMPRRRAAALPRIVCLSMKSYGTMARYSKWKSVSF